MQNLRAHSSKTLSKKSDIQQLFDFLLELRLFERAALNFVQADGVYKKLGAQEPAELTHIEFGNKDFLIAAQNFADVRRQRIQIAQVKMTDALASGKLLPLPLHGCRNGAVSRAPRYNEQVSLSVAF